MEDIPSFIKGLRLKTGMSQEDLARELGVSFTSVNRWENSQSKPSKLAIKQIERLHQELLDSGKL